VKDDKNKKDDLVYLGGPNMTFTTGTISIKDIKK